MIPGIPDPYFDECARGHALYVTGLSAQISPGEVKHLFEACGRVQRTIALIDMIAEETFRWVIMGSFAETQKALQERQGFNFGSRVMNLCYALPPGSAVPLFGRSIVRIYWLQTIELQGEDNSFKSARQECINKQPGVCCQWFDGMASANIARMGSEGHTAHSPFVGYVSNDASHEVWKTKLFNPPKWSPSFAEYMREKWAIDLSASPTQTNATTKERSPRIVQITIADQEKDALRNSLQSPASLSGSEASTIVPCTARRVTSTNIDTAKPVITASSIAAVASAVTSSAKAAHAPITPFLQIPPAMTSSWANIAAPAANASENLVFNLHLEKNSGSAAPRIQGPMNPDVIAHQQGESIEEQLRTVIIFNLPQTITLQDVSDAISEGPVLMIQFATDVDNGNRYVGIVFQYAEHAKAFREILLQERIESQPGRFRFVVEVGEERLSYPYDELLEDMEPPMNGTRRLTIVKKAFFFAFTKRELRKACSRIVGADKIQLIWLYNGGNASVVFADVKSAVAVKTKFDKMAANRARFGTNMVSFEGLSTNFSKDPCFTSMNLYTDIPEHNDE